MAEQRPGAWRIYAILLTLIAVPLFVLGEIMRLGAKGIGHTALPMLVGEVIGILLFPLLFVLVARLLARPYTQRSFWKAYAIGMLFCAMAGVSEFMGGVGAVQAKTEAAVTRDIEAAWTPYLSKKGGYRVEMPGTPEAMKVENGLGVKLITREAAYTASHYPLLENEQNALELYEIIANHYRTQLKAEVEDSALFHAGVVARELLVTLPTGARLRSRLYVKEGVMYEISVGVASFEEPLAARYLDSFELLAPQG